jgi:hypothetical protein
VLSRPSYKGLSYRQPNGSEFGLRWSERYGLTYDVITSNDYRPGFQDASKMTEEPTHWHYGTPMSEWMEQVANELPVDAVGMWQIVPAGRRGFKLEGEALTEYVRRQIGVLLSRGAVPVTGGGDEHEWIVQRQYGSRPAEIVENVVSEWLADGAREDDFRVWFALPEHAWTPPE